MIENWINIAVAFYLLFHFILGAKRGFRLVFINMASFIAALLVSFYSYKFLADFFIANFNLDESYANFIGFFAILFIAKTIIFLLLKVAFSKSLLKFKHITLDKFIGGIISLIFNLAVVFLFFSAIISLSLPYFIEKPILSSMIGGLVRDDIAGLNGSFKNIFGNVLETTVEKFDFLTVEVENDKKIDLGYTVANPGYDEKMEAEMLVLVNQERASLGLEELVVDEKIREAARKHGQNMFENGYFSHIDLEGGKVSDRIKREGVVFYMTGENLALSKDILSAHKGLMDSPGHKRNILLPFFHRIGIGAIDGKERGVIFVQNFAD